MTKLRLFYNIVGGCGIVYVLVYGLLSVWVSVSLCVCMYRVL